MAFTLCELEDDRVIQLDLDLASQLYEQVSLWRPLGAADLVNDRKGDCMLLSQALR
jgi:hypothetical protein